MGVIERLGEFNRFAPPGLNLLCCPFESMRGRLSTRVQQLNVNTQTKTKDNVTLTVNVAVQFRVITHQLEDEDDAFRGADAHRSGETAAATNIELSSLGGGRSPRSGGGVEYTGTGTNRAEDSSLLGGPAVTAPGARRMTRNDPRNHGLWRAYYRLTNPALQIQSYVEDTVRSELPRKTLDEAYEAKDDVAIAVKEALQHEMKQYGYEVVQTLVTDLQPDQKVISAMNEINAQRRMRLAAQEKAEAEKIIVVKRSEAEAEAKYLAGVGVARQRKAIVDGLKDSVLEFSGGVHGTSPQDVMHLMMVTQYLDMLKDVGSNPAATTLFVPHGVGAVSDMQEQVRNGMMQASAAAGRQ